MSAESSLRADIVEVGRRMYARGYTASNDGNISVRLDASRLLMTPKSVCKGFMTPDMMCITDLEGRKLQGERDPSSEMLMHLEVYRQRPDVQAVVHAHPPTATGFAVAGIPLDRAVLAEVLTTLGSIPIAEYATPSTKELPEAVRKYIKAHDGMLLANHGALTVGSDLFGAYYRMETIEHFAKISLVARMLGRENVLSREEVTRLQALRGTYGIAAPAPICPEPSTAPGTAALGPGPADSATCQRVQAPSGTGQRLILELTRGGARSDGAPGDGEVAPKPSAEPDPPSLAQRAPASFGEVSPKPLAQADPPSLAQRAPASFGEVSPKPLAQADGEIRLTYRELSALIEDAIRSLR